MVWPHGWQGQGQLLGAGDYQPDCSVSLPHLSLHHRLNVMSLKLGVQGQRLHPSAISPPRPMIGPLHDQRGGPYVTLYYTAFILLGSWDRDMSWLFPALPAHSPFCPAPQDLLCLCLATGSTSSGISLCQIQLFERPKKQKNPRSFPRKLLALESLSQVRFWGNPNQDDQWAPPKILVTNSKAKWTSFKNHP